MSSPSNPLRDLPPIEPLPPRYEPPTDPRTIHVPGLDTTASVQDQIEQIEQLITIKMQNIDANFARAHHILATRILPAVKRYSINTEPVREAAKFWVSFFEQAAQIRIPTSDELSTATADVSESEQQQTQEQASSQEPSYTQSDSENADVASDEGFDHSNSSFLPLKAGEGGVGAVSSTPMAHSHGRSRSRSRTQDNTSIPASWGDTISASMESPLDRLDRDFRSLKDDDESGNSVLGIPKKGKATAASSSGYSNALLQNVLSKNLHQHTSPLKVKTKASSNTSTTPKKLHLNRDWDGIVDLRSPRPLTVASACATEDENWTDSDSDDDLPPGMSPPVTMDFYRLPRKETRATRPTANGRGEGTSANRAMPKVTQSPAKDAARRIGRDLIGAVERKPAYGGVAQTNRFGFRAAPLTTRDHTRKQVAVASSAPGRRTYPDTSISSSIGSALSPPSLSMYSKRAMGIESSIESASGVERPSIDMSARSGSGADASLESMMRRVGLMGGESAAVSGERRSGTFFSEDDSFDEEVMHTPLPGQQASEDIGRGGGSDSSSDDSFDAAANHTGAPGAAFLMASQHAANRRRSSGSDEDDDESFAMDEQVGERPLIHPFEGMQGVGGDALEDDSFDDDDDMNYGGEDGGGVLRGAAFPAGGGNEDENEDPTVFGARTVAARAMSLGGAALSRGANLTAFSSGQPGGAFAQPELRLHGREVITYEDDTIGPGIGRVGGVPRRNAPETPTPWGGEGRGG